MFRQNPQLGNYCTIDVKTADRVTSKNVITPDGEKYDKNSGNRDSSSVYGSARYQAYTYEEIKKILGDKTDKINGYKISGMRAGSEKSLQYVEEKMKNK